MMVNGHSIRGFDRVFKVVVVGETGVGKTSLVGSLCDEPYIEERSATIGADVKQVTLTVDGKRVKLMIWDTAGQEKFRTLTPAFYRGAHLILLCFDITKYDTFQRVESWFEELTLSAGTSPNVVKLLIGTKFDRANHRVVEREEAVEMAGCNECACYLETSAYTGSGVKEAFRQGVKTVLSVPELNAACESALKLSNEQDEKRTGKCC